MMEAVAPLNNEPSTKSEPTTSIQYSAFGYVLGHLKLDAENPKMGKLLLTDETILPVYLFHQSKLDQISLEKLYAWRIYFRSDREQNLSGLKLVEAIEVKDETQLEKLLPSYAALDHFRIRGRIHNVWKGQISLRLERNNVPARKENLPQWKPFYITVLGKLEQRVNKGEAIEITARREGMQLHLVEANPIDETVVESKTDKKRKKAEFKREKALKLNFYPKSVNMPILLLKKLKKEKLTQLLLQVQQLHQHKLQHSILHQSLHQRLHLQQIQRQESS